MDARALAADYAGLGYDPIPVIPGEKRAILPRYQVTAGPLQWGQIGARPAAVGLRPGGPAQAAFWDCDEDEQPGTFANVTRYLAGLGYMPDGDYPIVKTRSDGRHVYVSFTGGLPGHFRLLARAVGKGEFRYGPAALVVAPGGDEPYTLIEGDLRQLPKLEAADVLPMLGNQDTGATDGAAAILATAPSTPGRIGRQTWALLSGDGVAAYPSRSEAEAAIIAGLVNAGLSFGAILSMFQNHPAAGKFYELYTENPNRGIGYLRHTWENATKWTEAHPSEGRKLAFEAIQWAQSTPWPGRTGRTDHAAFLAHAMTAYTSGRGEYNLSERELAELAGIGQDTAHKANKRLRDAELIERIKGQHDACGILWRVKCIILSIPHTPAYEGLIGLCTSGDSRPPTAHDAFRFRGLGKSAAELWSLLRATASPMTAGKLAERSGRNITTVRRVLGRLAHIVDPATGEIFRLVERDGDGWRALEADLDAIARAIGTAGVGERQKAKHERERQGWHARIERERLARP